MKIYKSFEDWLHNEIHPGVAMADGKLDDDWPDHESEWLAGLSVEEWFNYADKFAQLKHAEGFKQGHDRLALALSAVNDANNGKVA